MLCQIELEALEIAMIAIRVTEGTRTPDLRDHNPAL